MNEEVFRSWKARVRAVPSLVRAPYEELARWDRDIAPRLVEDIESCNGKDLPDSPRPLLELTRIIREKGDPYLAAQVLFTAAERCENPRMVEFLRARGALYLCAYSLFEEAYALVEHYLHDPGVSLKARVFASRVASLRCQYAHMWDRALEWNQKEEQLIREGMEDPEIAYRLPVVYLNRVHILLHRFRTRSLDEEPVQPDSREVRELARALRAFHARRARYPDFYTFAWPVLVESYLFAGRTDRARRLIRYVLSSGKRYPPELLAAMHFYRAVVEFREGRPGSMAALKEALRLAMEGGAFFRERDILYTAVRLLRNLPGSAEGNLLAQYEELFRALLQLLAEKDLYTAGDHALRVSWIAYWIGRTLTEKDTSLRRAVFPRSLAIAGLVHDIGKLFLPWVLLNRVRPFTEEEWKLIREHVRYGVEALEILGMPGVARVVAEHHERMDGTGYPQGLTRKEISLMGAVLAAADTFEAATSPNRHYRPPKAPEVVLREMEGGYHPRVLEALRELVSRGSLLRDVPSLPTWLEMIRRGI